MFSHEKQFHHFYCVFFLLLFTSACFSQLSLLRRSPEQVGVNALLVDQGNLIAATTQGIFIYRNNGSSTRKIVTNIDNKEIIAITKQSTTLYAASWDTIYRTMDGGMTWKELKTFPKQIVFSLCADPIREGRLYAGLSDGLYRSTNHGDSWERITKVNIPITSCAVNDSSVFAFGSSDRLYRLNSRTDEIIEERHLPRSGDPFTSLVVDEYTSALFLLSYYGLFQSINNGLDWSSIYQGTIFSLATAPNRSLYAGTVNGFVISADGKKLNDSPILREGIVSALARDGNTLYAGMGTGEIYSSRDEGKSWEPFTEGLADPYVAELVFTHDQFYASTQTRGVFRSNDGIQWTNMNLSFPYSPSEPSAGGTVTSIIVNQEEIVAATPFHGVHRSTDAGVTWLSINDGLPRYEVYRVVGSPTDSNEYFAMAGGGFYRLRASSKRWEAFEPSLPDSDIVSVAVTVNPRTDRQLFLLGTVNSGLLVFTEGEQHWVISKKGLTEKIYIYDIHVIENANTRVMLLGTSDGIFRSTNLGESWDRVYQLQPDATNYGVLAFASNSTFLFAGTAGGNIMLSSDSGISWTVVDIGIPYLTKVWRMVLRNDILWIATLGTGLQHVSLSQLKMYATAEVVSETLNSAPREFSLLQNYPNPFNATTTFSFSIAETRTVSLKIYDIQGREIETVLESELQPDTYKIPWQARAYASGIYFFRLIAGSYVSTIKLVIVK